MYAVMCANQCQSLCDNPAPDAYATYDNYDFLKIALQLNDHDTDLCKYNTDDSLQRIKNVFLRKSCQIRMTRREQGTDVRTRGQTKQLILTGEELWGKSR